MKNLITIIFILLLSITSIAKENELIKIDLTLHYINGCEDTKAVLSSIDSLISNESIKLKYDIKYTKILILNNTEAKEYKFRGSPTIYINGEDISSMKEPSNYALACRFYQNGPPNSTFISNYLKKAK